MPSTVSTVKTSSSKASLKESELCHALPMRPRLSRFSANCRATSEIQPSARTGIVRWVNVDRSATLQDLAARCNFELQNYRDAAILYKPLTQSRSPARHTDSLRCGCGAGGAALPCTSSTPHWAWSAPASIRISVSPLPVCFAGTGAIRPLFGTWGTIGVSAQKHSVTLAVPHKPP